MVIEHRWKKWLYFYLPLALFIVFTSRDLTYVQVAFNVVFLLAFFMPLTYVVDLFVYRTLWRRYEKDRAAKRAGQARG